VIHLVVDASVAVKWVLPERGEAHTNEAISLLRALGSGGIELTEPPHWLAEVAAVVVRLRPEAARPAIALLEALEIPVLGDRQTYELACDIAGELKHHLFDALYHAVALRSGAELVTADEQYARKGRRFGAVRRLAEARDLLPLSGLQGRLAGARLAGSSRISRIARAQ
jgi:predicted nucleic acid-binding protein